MCTTRAQGDDPERHHHGRRDRGLRRGDGEGAGARDAGTRAGVVPSGDDTSALREAVVHIFCVEMEMDPKDVLTYAFDDQSEVRPGRQVRYVEFDEQTHDTAVSGDVGAGRDGAWGRACGRGAAASRAAK